MPSIAGRDLSCARARQTVKDRIMNDIASHPAPRDSGQPVETTGAEESRAVAEGARQERWEKRSFMKELFDGKLSLELVHPHPVQNPAEAEEAKPFLKRLERFVDEHVDGDAVDRDGWVPDSVLEGLAALGAFGIKIPKRYGGLGLSQTSYNRALALVASRCGATGAFLSAHQSIGVPTPLVLFGTEDQKRKYLPRAAGGELSAFALTEPMVGSDPAKMSTSATLSEDGTHYVLDGEKLWTTNGPRAGLIVVMARTPPRDGVRGKRPISAFVVERDWPGVEVAQECSFMGLKGISNGVLRFRNVKVPSENLLWGEGLGLKLALVTLNTGRLALPAFCAAVGKGCLRACRKWAGEREQWGQAVGKHDAVAQMLGRMAAETYAMEATVDLAAGLADGKQVDIRIEAAAAKLWHTEKTWELVDDAVQIRGGRGYETADSLRQRGEDPEPLERVMRDSRINRIFEGSSEIMRLFIAREAVDGHLQAAGAAVDARAPTGRRIGAAARAFVHYAFWYPRRWVGWGWWPRYRGFGPLARHMRFANRASRRLARTLFHCMMRFGPKLEQRQAVLGRLVDIGADLFVMVAACVRAEAMRGAEVGAAGTAAEAGAGTEAEAEARVGAGAEARTKAGADAEAETAGAGSASRARGAVELADQACRLARRRVKANFRAVFRNDDATTYRLARHALDGRYDWLEEGIVAAWPSADSPVRSGRSASEAESDARAEGRPGQRVHAEQQLAG